jgi:myo-inositol-1(or 4)-monophosphatase
MRVKPHHEAEDESQVNSSLPGLSELKGIIADATERVIPRGGRLAPTQAKADGSLVTEVDVALQDLIGGQLKERWPQYLLLGEEMPVDEQQRLLAGISPFWCLDPLDGTTNFAAGVPFFSVSLALIDEGRPVLGVVHDPMRGEWFSAKLGEGAWRNEEPLQVGEVRPSLAQSIAVVDFKRLDRDLATRLARAAPYYSQRNFGSCALEWCWLAAGRVQVYLHGGMRLWDHAAGSLILNEAGGCSCTLAGEPLSFTNIAPSSVVAGCSPNLFEAWKQWLGRSELAE